MKRTMIYEHDSVDDDISMKAEADIDGDVTEPGMCTVWAMRETVNSPTWQWKNVKPKMPLHASTQLIFFSFSSSP